MKSDLANGRRNHCGYSRLFLGGGISTAISSWRAAKKTQAEADALGLKTPVEVESMQVSSMDIVIKNLHSENKLLREDRDYWKGMYNTIKDEVDNLVKEMDDYRRRITELQMALQDAASHAPSDQA